MSVTRVDIQGSSPKCVSGYDLMTKSTSIAKTVVLFSLKGGLIFPTIPKKPQGKGSFPSLSVKGSY